ncbi:hypothetical protein [Halomonas korlensis]|uniref:Uncharacterized protein n=1 Tax=Halomonas korlensis TaxID=463301 RepID=A0A1I7GKS7_9GAMM|nr:hypothetical protein [Halomonas korlensis]SFU49043.1 hypothetical protein SAMN04487955_10381 [Halomonas korlensis]
MTKKSATLAWIDPNDSTQLEWIIGYLKRTQTDHILSHMPYAFGVSQAGNALVAAIEAQMGKAEFRERHRKMQGAWRQQKSRDKRDTQTMTHQVPLSVIRALHTLAKKRKQSKVETLSQVIEDASRDYQRETEKAKKAKATYQRRLKEQRVKYQETEKIYKRVVDTLLNALAEETDLRCRLEVMAGGWDSSVLGENERVEYQGLVESRATGLESTFADLNLVRAKVATLRQRMQVLADSHGTEQHHADDTSVDNPPA